MQIKEILVTINHVFHVYSFTFVFTSIPSLMQSRSEWMLGTILVFSGTETKYDVNSMNEMSIFAKTYVQVVNDCNNIEHFFDTVKLCNKIKKVKRKRYSRISLNSNNRTCNSQLFSWLLVYPPSIGHRA